MLDAVLAKNSSPWSLLDTLDSLLWAHDGGAMVAFLNEEPFVPWWSTDQEEDPRSLAPLGRIPRGMRPTRAYAVTRNSSGAISKSTGANTLTRNSE